MLRSLFHLGALAVLLLSSSLIPASQRAAAGPVPIFESLWVTPQEIDFGPVGLDATTSAITVTITNKANTPLANFAGGGVSTPFNVLQDCSTAGVIQPNQSCHYYFTFTPTAVGDSQAVSTTSTNLGSFAVTMHGKGVVSRPVISAYKLDFGSVYTGKGGGMTARQTVTVRNAGLAPLTGLSWGPVTSPFSFSHDCTVNGAVPPGGSCHYYFTFAPDAVGPYTAQLNTFYDIYIYSIDLQGSGTGLLVTSGRYVSPLSLNFGPVGVGTTSQVLTATITNQSLIQSVTNFSLGSVGAPFNMTEDCTPSLGPNSACHLSFTFSPTSTGTFSAGINNSDSEGPYSIYLYGSGIAPSLTVNPLSIDFGPQLINSRSRFLVSFTNTGLSPITGWGGGAPPDPFYGGQSCASGLQPGKTCYFTYTFQPTAQGVYDADSRINNSAGNFTVHMHGEGTYLGVFIPVLNK